MDFSPPRSRSGSAGRKPVLSDRRSGDNRNEIPLQVHENERYINPAVQHKTQKQGKRKKTRKQNEQT